MRAPSTAAAIRLTDHQSSRSAFAALQKSDGEGGGLVHRFASLLLHSRRRWGRGDRLHDLRRQAETHVLRHDLQFLHVVKPLVPRNFTTSSTRHSGAEAPAVNAIVFTPSSHSGRILRKLSIRCESVPKFRATSTKRLEFELLSEPTTSSRSASEATCFTATWRFSVA